MKGLALVAGWIAYAVVGIIQIIASVDGVQYFTGFGSFFSWVIAMLLGWTPLIGTAFGIYGAHKVWNWTLLNSFLLFVGIPGFFIVLSIITAGIGTAMARRKSI
jgi:hypothetical protein